jgi:hypothetical protein
VNFLRGLLHKDIELLNLRDREDRTLKVKIDSFIKWAVNKPLISLPSIDHFGNDSGREALNDSTRLK